MREKGEYLLPANSLLWREAEPPSPGDGVQEWRWMDAAGEAGANCGKKGRENWEEPYLVFALRLLSSLCAAAAAKSLQSYPTLCDPIDGSPPGSPIPGILQARTLEWVAISFSNAWKEKWKWSRPIVSDSYWPHGLQPTRLLRPWDFPGRNTGVGCHSLLPLCAGLWNFCFNNE